jgi:CheY-like chemotaxis protein
MWNGGEGEVARSRGQSRERLLVVDDDPALGALVGSVGEALGFDVAVTESAADFIAAFLDRAPDVIVLESVLPDRDGIELMRWLVAAQCRARIVVITRFALVYARAMTMLGETLGGLSVTVLTKPVSQERLARVLRGV